MQQQDKQYKADDRDDREPIDPMAVIGGTLAERHLDIIGGHPDLAALFILWANRDVEYAKRSTRLPEASIEAIREWRKREAGELKPALRAKAWARAATWYPPEHGQGTGADKAQAGLGGWL